MQLWCVITVVDYVTEVSVKLTVSEVAHHDVFNSFLKQLTFAWHKYVLKDLKESFFSLCNHGLLHSFPDVNATTMNMTVIDPLGNVTDLTGSCSLNLTVQLNHTLKFCCSNPGTACYPRILINKNIISHDQPGCIFYTFKDVKFREASLELSYSLCSQKSGIVQKVCETPETGKLISSCAVEKFM